jgi:anti-sigma B factor antagonist
MDELEAQSQPAVAFEVVTDQAGTAIVTISGELDMSSIEALETAVAPALAARPARLIVDIGGLRFADSSAIALWVRWAGTVSQFELRDPSPLLRRVITAMGLAQKLEPKP